MCADVALHERADGRLMVQTPFVFSDGDTYAIYLESLPGGGVRITDAGQTLMHLSYSIDVNTLREGRRAQFLEKILSESSVTEKDGELYVDSPLETLGGHLFSFGQAITRVHDLSLWRRHNIAATFYEDLERALAEIVPPERIHKDHLVPGIENAQNYPVDFYLEGQRQPLYLFGVPTKDKARLATIILQHLTANKTPFESILVFQDQELIPRPDLARLSNAGGEQVASLAAQADLRRKVLKLVA